MSLHYYKCLSLCSSVSCGRISYSLQHWAVLHVYEMLLIYKCGNTKAASEMLCCWGRGMQVTPIECWHWSIPTFIGCYFLYIALLHFLKELDKWMHEEQRDSPSYALCKMLECSASKNTIINKSAENTENCTTAFNVHII